MVRLHEDALIYIVRAWRGGPLELKICVQGLGTHERVPTALLRDPGEGGQY